MKQVKLLRQKTKTLILITLPQTQLQFPSYALGGKLLQRQSKNKGSQVFDSSNAVLGMAFTPPP
jgi:hypothetical protein